MTVSGKLFSLRWAFFLTYVLFLYGAFTLPADEIPSAITRVNDKFFHGLGFFLLALLAFRAFFYSPLDFFHASASGKAGGFSLAYGGFLEWMQRSIPGRSASVSDFLADAGGTFFACLLIRFWQRRVRRLGGD